MGVTSEVTRNRIASTVNEAQHAMGVLNIQIEVLQQELARSADNIEELEAMLDVVASGEVYRVHAGENEIDGKPASRWTFIHPDGSGFRYSYASLRIARVGIWR
jgi:hypothetical protein